MLPKADRPEQQKQEALDALTRALAGEYRFILYYPTLERLMPDADAARTVRILGKASVKGPTNPDSSGSL